MRGGRRRGAGREPDVDTTRAICERYARRRDNGDAQADIIADLAAEYGVLRPAIRRRLHIGGAMVEPSRVKTTREAVRPQGFNRAPRPPSRLVKKSPAVSSGIEAPVEPCPRCGVRADVGCKHRPAEGVPPQAIVRTNHEKRDGRSRPNSGQGWNFHRGDLARNLEAAQQRLTTGSRDD